MSCTICKTNSNLKTHYISDVDCISLLNSCELCTKCYDDAEDGHIIVEAWVMTPKGLKLMWHKDEDTYYSSSESE